MNLLKAFLVNKECNCTEEKLIITKKVKNILNNYMKLNVEISRIYSEKLQCDNTDVSQILKLYIQERKELYKAIYRLEKKIAKENK